jgi:hypothetical protein
MMLPTFAATLWVDGDETNAAADFHSIEEALAAAQQGDTLFVAPWANSYGRVTLNQAVTLIGPGWPPSAQWPDTEDVTPDPARPEPSRARLGRVTITQGGSGAVLMGFELDGIHFSLGGRDAPPISDVLVYRNYFSIDSEEASFSSGSSWSNRIVNLFVVNNLISRTVRLVSAGNSSAHVESAFFFNNFFVSHVDSIETFRDVRTRAYIEFRNNIFRNAWQDITLDRGVFTGNIVQRGPADDNDSGTFYSADTLVEGNLFVRHWPETSNVSLDVSQVTNRLAPSMESVFVWEGATMEETWALASNSPARGVTPELHLGVWGGKHPWDPVSGRYPPLPTVTSLKVPAVVSQGEELRIEIEARANR